MKDLQKHIKNNYIDLLVVFGINFFLGLCVFAKTMLQNKGIFTLCNDFNLQQLPLNMLANKAIHEGNIDWTWNIDLGSSFIGSTSFYVTGSPFFYLSLLFPASWYPRLAGWLFILKYAVAGVTSYLYCRQFSKQKKYAVIASVLYAFSGFQATNMLFYHFHDVVAFFPLLLYGLDVLIQQKKKGVFAFAVFICSFINFYFFVGEVVFLIIYFICRYWITNWKYYKDIIWCLWEGILGVGMAMVIFLPSIMFNLDNPRISDLIPMSRWFEIDRRDLLYIIRTLFLPPEDMVTLSYVKQEDYSSRMLYLPMVACVPAFMYCVKNRKSWLSRTVITFMIISIVPLFNSIFYFFGSNNYHRWFYMLLLLMSVATQKVLEEHEKYKLSLVTLIMGLFLVGLLFGTFWWDTNKFQMIFEQEEFLWIFIVGIAGMFWTSFMNKLFYTSKQYFQVFLVSIGFFAVLTNFHVCEQYQKMTNMNFMNGNEKAEDYNSHLIAYVDYENPNKAYRFSGIDNFHFMVGDISSDACFCSTVNGSIMELHSQITEGREVFTPYKENGLNELFSAKYYISHNERKADKLIDTIDYTEEKTDYIYERNNILPIGFSYDSYVLQSELSGYSNEQKRLIMLQTLVIPDQKEEKIKTYLAHFDLQEAILDWEKLQGIWTSYHKEVSEDFFREKNKFGSKIKMDKQGVIFYSVPFDKGWTAEVNGKKTEILNVNGLMAVTVETGDNSIEFVNRNMYLRVGFLITIVSFAIWFLYRKEKFMKIVRR